MELKVVDFSKGKAAAKMKVTGDFLDKAYNEDLIHQVVTSYMATARQGSKANKSRSDVRGGGAKPWRQKGTGRARAGTRSSPIWRSGGVTFAASPRNYAKKVNRKMYVGAMQSILSELVRNDKLQVTTEFDIDKPKTKDFAKQLTKLGLDDVLIVSGEVDNNLYLSARNIPNIGIIDVVSLDPLSLLSYKKVLMTKSAVKQLEERFK